VTGTPWEYLAAIHLVETRMGRIHGTSTAGAQGPMQFIPETWEIYGAGDIYDDRDAIRAAARYLADRGAPGVMPQALFSYNNDNRYVAAIESYAQVLRADPRAYDGYHAWQVFFSTEGETYLLPEGYGTP
jgi:membrane-bound lytic murein transglycosylase MltF